MKEESTNTIDFLNEEEWQALLSIPDIQKPSGLRNLCIIVLMLDAGMKVSEIVGKEKKSENCDSSPTVMGGIRLENINLETGEIVVEGKNRKFRTVYLNDKAKHMIKQWLKVRPDSDTDLLFTNLNGGKLNNRYIREFLEKYGVKAGISKKVHPSLLRHTFAKDLYTKSKNLRMVQKTLGVSDLKQTLRYAEVDDDDIKLSMKNLRGKN
jgi:integrase/recombinase XerD